MSIWKKIAGLLFEENDAVIADDELEDISFPEEEAHVYKKSKTKPQENYIDDDERKYTSFVEEAKKAEVKEVVKSEEPIKKFVSIEIEDDKTVVEKPKEVRTSTRTMHSNVVKEEKKEYEFSPVISPIFGSKEEESAPKGKAKSVSMPKSKRENPLGTVISPYFGFGELEEFKAEAQEHIEKKEKSLQEEVPVEEILFYEEEDDINSVSIDDIIVDQESEEDEDDIMQISLFGESTPISDSDEDVCK